MYYLLGKLHTELCKIFPDWCEVFANDGNDILKVCCYGGHVCALISDGLDALPMDLRMQWNNEVICSSSLHFYNEKVHFSEELRFKHFREKYLKFERTLTIAVSGASQAFSVSWTKSWIEFDITLKTYQITGEKLHQSFSPLKSSGRYSRMEDILLVDKINFLWQFHIDFLF